MFKALKHLKVLQVLHLKVLQKKKSFIRIHTAFILRINRQNKMFGQTFEYISNTSHTLKKTTKEIVWGEYRGGAESYTNIFPAARIRT